MQGNQCYLKAFKDLGSSEVIRADTLKTLEKFVCQVYGDKKCDSVNELRYKKLVSKGTKKKKTPSASSSDPEAPATAPKKTLVELYKKMKRTNPVSFPPCYASFKQQAARTNLVSNMWKQAPNQRLKLWDKTKHGYKIENGKCVVHWFDGEETPDLTYSELEEHEEPTEECETSDDSDSDSDNDSDSENSDSDTD